MAHPNIERMETGYEAFSKGDMKTIDGLWADDITWHSYGPGPFSGTFEGKQAIFELFGTIPQMTDHFELRVHDILANDSHAVVMVDQTVRRGDRVWEGKAVHVYHLSDGMVTEAFIQPVDESSLPEDFWD